MFWDNHLLIVRLYIFIFLTFLFIACYSLSIGILKVFYIRFFLNIKISSVEISKINNSQIQSLVDSYITKKQWLLVIAILELYKDKYIKFDPQINQILGFCYEELLYLNIAKYYYLKILNKENIYLCYGLISLYKKLNNVKEVKNLSFMISNLH